MKPCTPELFALGRTVNKLNQRAGGAENAIGKIREREGTSGSLREMIPQAVFSAITPCQSQVGEAIEQSSARMVVSHVAATGLSARADRGAWPAT